MLGGTGDVGGGLLVRWGADASHDLVVGSRDEERAVAAAREYRELLAAHVGDEADAGEHAGASPEDAAADDASPDDAGPRIVGRSNAAAAASADVVVLAVPPEFLDETIASVRDGLDDETVLVSPAVALDLDDAGARYREPDRGSFTAVAADAAPAETPVVGAFHTLSAPRLADLDRSLEIDTLVVGDDPEARATVAALAEAIAGLRAVDAGPLANAAAVEALTPLLITVGRHDDALLDPGVRFS